PHPPKINPARRCAREPPPCRLGVRSGPSRTRRHLIGALIVFALLAAFCGHPDLRFLMAEPARLRKVVFPALLVIGDALVAFGGLSLGYWLRYVTPVGSIGLDVPDARYATYLPLLL